jgi:hypothetical protein
MVATMKLSWMTLPALFLLTACPGKDDGTDSGTDADGGADLDDTGTEPAPSIIDAPGCSTAGVACLAYGPGVLWATQNLEANCASLSEDSVAAERAEMVFLADGCPDGPYAQCTDIPGVSEEDGTPVAGAEYTTYYYSGISSDNAMSHCAENGGTYEVW